MDNHHAHAHPYAYAHTYSDMLDIIERVIDPRYV